ncbi:iron(III) transport system substrate-binding protein [Antricoccus suffuscus]|uniref:Iron(III) transport system substrate-binding protein n=1 Tax=Antricoccus suffuscus TaxID=1629062 RepID=A0A2T0ZB32_9ACTN|nr:extracellular solute-binding protein [Antricoccus suffuscus]PRZ33553.1 iron(III) transport system substrate-binding protein [Antricoccus suffuscus]
MNRHLKFLAAPILALALGLAACGGGSTTDGAGKDLADKSSPYLADAQKEGAVTWYTAHYDSETAETVKSLFEEAYPKIKVSLYRQTAQRIYQRYSQEEDAGQPSADLLGITEMGIVAGLAKDGKLLPFKPRKDLNRISAYSAYDDPAGYYHIGAVGNNIISYNTDQVKPEDAPKNWSDLLDPKWKGKIATGNPGASGYVGTWATQMYLMFGDQYLVNLQKQDVLVGQSVTDTIPRVAGGERAVGVSSDQTVAQAIKDGSPIAMVYPEDGAVIMPCPNAIPKSAKHPAAAKLLAEFILSKGVQKYLAENASLLPVIEGVNPPKNLDGAKTADYIRPELPALESTVPVVIKRWQALFGA